MTLIYVMGPSGAGKDTVLRLARADLGPGERIAFAHRYITRPPDPRHENYVALSPTEFETRRSANLFAFDWDAHGFRYAVGLEIDTWQHMGFTVVVSGSRAHFAAWRQKPEKVRPVLITAPPEILAQRLAARGREPAAAQAERLNRGRVLAIDDPEIAAIDNSGPPEIAAAAFLKLLRS